MFVGERKELKGAVGSKPLVKLYLYQHTHFVVQYNDDRVIQISVGPHTEDKLDITDASVAEVTFEYSVAWEQVTTPFSQRHVQFQKDMFNKQDLKVGSGLLGGGGVGWRVHRELQRRCCVRTVFTAAKMAGSVGEKYRASPMNEAATVRAC